MSDSDLDVADGVGEEEGRRWLVVRVDEGTYALPAEDVAEISHPRPATPLPGAPAWIRGLVNHRGAVVPVVDLGRLLGRQAISVADYRLVLVRRGAHLIALATGQVLGFGDSFDVPAEDPSVLIDLDALFQDIF
jgi:chemotaxis signal transduction protein